jgi:hypothetical protein
VTETLTRCDAGVPPSVPVPEPVRVSRRLHRLDRRGRAVLAIAAAVAVLVNSAVVWAYWNLSRQGAGVSPAGSAIQLKLLGTSDDSDPMVPGSRAALTVTVPNQHTFPVRITSLRPGAGRVTADPEHRQAGCRATGVAVPDSLTVSWQVPRNTVGVFTVPDLLTFTAGSDPACRGAVFTIPVRATGISDSP